LKFSIQEPTGPEPLTANRLKPGELAQIVGNTNYKGEIVALFGDNFEDKIRGIQTLVSLSIPSHFWNNPEVIQVRRLNPGATVTLTQEGIPVIAPPAKYDPLAAVRARIDAILFDADRREVRKFIRRGEIINAIKFVREKTSEGLKEAKDYVEYTRDHTPYDEQ
jgi:hypothetical protein